jgi:ABC-type transport system substrate-binding protein
MVYDAEPTPGDAEAQAIAARFKGRRLPMIDRVEISIIEEDLPRWLAFVNGEADFVYRLGYEFVPTAMPHGKVAPNLAKKGVQGFRVADPATQLMLFNMEDPVVGGYAPERIALRRAIALGMDTRTEIQHAYSGLGMVAQTLYLPFTSGFDPRDKSEFGDYDPARAKALLDIYVDRDGDGWREMPDGSPLVLRVASQSDQRSRRINEVFHKNMEALGIRVGFNIAQWPENLKAARAGKLAMWSVGSYASAPDGQGALTQYHSKQIGGENFARFRLPAFDALYERIQVLPDGPEREALFREAQKLAIAYMPYKHKLSRLSTDMAYPWVVGYRRPVFWTHWWQYVDIDESRKPRRSP